MNRAGVAILLAFLVMGVADAMGPLSDAVEKQFAVSSVTATMLPFFVFIAFAAFSVPGGLLAGRIGAKNLLLLGLGLNAAAMLVPSVIDPGFGLLLTCIFGLGVGTTLLQVAGNPMMREVSKEGNYSRNLSLAQGVKGLGSASSAYLVTGISAIGLFQTMGWRGAFPVFFVLMVLALVLVASSKIEETKPDAPPGIADSLALLKESVFAARRTRYLSLHRSGGLYGPVHQACSDRGRVFQRCSCTLRADRFLFVVDDRPALWRRAVDDRQSVDLLSRFGRIGAHWRVADHDRIEAINDRGDSARRAGICQHLADAVFNHG